MERNPAFAHWERVRQGTLTTLALFLEDELGFAPAEGGRSIREIALHIAHEEAIEVQYGAAYTLTAIPEPFQPRDYPTRQAIADLLRAVHARSLDFLDSLDGPAMEAQIMLAWGESSTPLKVILHMIEHEAHHRGELSLALGILGRTGYDA